MTGRPADTRSGAEGRASDVTDEGEAPVRPPRPAAVEIASAFLIVNGLLSIFVSLDSVSRLGDQTPGIEPLALLSVAIGVATVVLGALLHFGRGWLVTLNVTAIAGFLELVSGLPAGWIAGAVDVAVVLVLLWHRPWFAWSPDASPGEEG